MLKRALISLAVAAAIVSAAVSCSPSFGVYDLECEGLDAPLGIDSGSPHFSWKIRSDKPMEQVAYEIQVASSLPALKSGKADIWSSGRVTSADQVMVPYGGAVLGSRQQCWWRVRVWKSEGEASGWGEPQRFGIGVIAGDSLKGNYIGAALADGKDPIFRKSFEVSRTGEAVLHVNSLGYHEAYINGEKVSEAVLVPAVSQLDKRSLIVTYDVSRFLRKGTNEIAIIASSGWYKPRTFRAGYDGPLVKAELDALSPEGPRPLVWTDGSWTAAYSGYRDFGTWRDWQFGGEEIDSRVIPQVMDGESLGKLDWKSVDVVDVEGIEATPMMCEPCVPQETFHAVGIEPYGEGGSYLVDFGRVVNGMLDITLPPMAAGHVSTASFCDGYEPDGTLDPVSSNFYISSGASQGDRFTNKFSHHVFRYVILDSLETAPKLEDIKAVRMRTGYDAASTFKSSDEDLNAIHDMIHYTVENLAFNGYMVDCAHIERLGYGGDGNASALTLQTMFDCSPLYVNWLQAWNDCIHEDGGLPHTAPCPYRAGGGPYWCGFIVQAPWRTWMSYGDPRLLERCYPTMLHWLDYVDTYTVDGLLKKWPDTEYRTWYLGDWAAPRGIEVGDQESVDLVNNCSLCQVYKELEVIAGVVGHPEDAAGFRARFDALAKRINETLYHPETQTYGSGTQIDMVYPLLVGIVPDDLRKPVRDKLMERTATVYEGHLKTGLVGVPVITEWATLAGECDWMYGMLKQRTYPGYLYMIDNGATSTWEYWSADRSRMHNCYNGIGSWFYQALGGIIPTEPGYRRIKLDPQITEGLQSVEVTKETPYGPVRIVRNGRELHFEIPVGMTAVFQGKEFHCGQYDVEIQ